MNYVEWINYLRWRRIMPFSVRKPRSMVRRGVDPLKAMYVYVLIKNGVPEEEIDPTGVYRRAYKYLVGWYTVVDEDGKVIQGPDADIKRLHEEGIL